MIAVQTRRPISVERSLIVEESLSRTVDAVDEAMFFARAISRQELEGVARWIASLEEGYARMPSPQRLDWCGGIRVFTGEPVDSSAGIGHVAGEEACRLLRRIRARGVLVREAMERGSAGMIERLMAHEDDGYPLGTYCCGHCTPAMWRHLAAGGLDDRERLTVGGMRYLRSRRNGRGDWARFPFHYTVLALIELDHPLAVAELRYAAPLLEKVAARPVRDDKYRLRRKTLAERALAMC